VVVTLELIRQAQETLTGQIVRTPLPHSRTLSTSSGTQVWIKFENLQFTASFKERSARNRLSPLSAYERRRGVIAMSAGNHAQGVVCQGK